MTWRPGQSGNPRGRPRKEQCIPDILRKILSEPHEGTGTVLEAILRGGTDKALRADLEWVKFIAERTEGKVKDVLDLHLTDMPTAEEMARWLTGEELVEAEAAEWDGGRIRAIIAERRQAEASQGAAAVGLVSPVDP